MSVWDPDPRNGTPYVSFRGIQWLHMVCGFSDAHKREFVVGPTGIDRAEKEL
jgi:hypothetical protein